jgi:uncharacterized Zn finger protein (UPF0148 family)
MMPPHCKKCDTVNRDSAVFCDRCGSRLEKPEEQPPVDQAEYPEAGEAEKYSETAPRPEED